MPCCVALGCSNRHEKGVRLFGFPTDLGRRGIWEANVRRAAGWRSNGNRTKLCEAHFDDDQFEKCLSGGKRKLRKDAVPTLFPHLCDSRKKRRPLNRSRATSDMPGSRLAVDHSYSRRPELYPQPVQNDEKKSLSSYGVKEDDMLLLERKNTSSNPPRTRPQGPPATGSSLFGIDFGGIQVPGTSRQGASPRGPAPALGANPAEPDPAMLREMLLSNEYQLLRLRETNPPLAEAVNSLEKFTEVLQKQRKMKAEQEMQRIRMLSADPMDASAQKLIAEDIRQRNVNDNMETAIEHMPENFGQVIMLYIDCVVNNHPVKAFVDSGAQMTIMSQACAERCNIMRLVDRRWQGIAKGVGTQKIIGRVHLGQISIGGTYFPTSFTILENQPMDMLLGLDMLKRHQCCIDLKENKLKIGTTGTETPFLSESDLPACARQDTQEGGKSEDQQLAEALAKSAEDMETDASNNTNQSNSQPPAAAAAIPGVSESDIKKITDMGYSRQDAVRELSEANGDFNIAIVKLLAKSLKAPGQQ